MIIIRLLSPNDVRYIFIIPYFDIYVSYWSCINDFKAYTFLSYDHL